MWVQHMGPRLGNSYDGLLGQQHSKQCSCTLQCISHYVKRTKRNVYAFQRSQWEPPEAAAWSSHTVNMILLRTRSVMILRACLCAVGTQTQKCLGTRTKLSTNNCLYTLTRSGMGTQCNFNLNQQNFTKGFCTLQCISHRHDRR